MRRRAAGETLRALAADYGGGAHDAWPLLRASRGGEAAARGGPKRAAGGGEDLSPAEIGLSFSLGNAGWLVGAVTATRISTRFGIGPTLIGTAALGGWGFLLIPLAPTSMAILFISMALFVFGVCAVVNNIVAISLSQAVTPDRLLGRMTASRRFAVFGVIPLGSLTAGALGSSLGLHTAIWICAIGASVAFLPMLLSPVRSVRTLKDAEHSLGLIHDQIPA